jgi:hypothetical protein
MDVCTTEGGEKGEKQEKRLNGCLLTVFIMQSVTCSSPRIMLMFEGLLCSHAYTDHPSLFKPFRISVL